MEIEIDYKPRKWTKNFHNTLKRWIFLLLHRRAGKTTAILNHLQRDCIRIPKSLFAYIGPTYKQTKRMSWDIAKDMSKDIPDINRNISELSIEYPNGSKLYLAGSDNIDSIRGVGLWGAGLDEYPLQSPILFSQVVSKCLADHLGYCIFSGTPKGKGDFYKTYQIAGKHTEDWELIERNIDQSLKFETGKTIDNLKIALEDDRKLVKQGMMTIDEFNQEWYNSFEAAVRGAWYSEQLSDIRKQNRYKPLSYDRGLKVHTVWDIGVGPALGIGFYQRVSAREMHMIDYWEGMGNQGIIDGIKAVQDKPYIYGKHFAPHDIKAKEEFTGKTRIDSAAALGIKFKVVDLMTIINGIDKGKLFFSRLYVNSDLCGVWLDMMSQYKRQWDESKNMFLDEPYKNFATHAADVHRYAAVMENEMDNESIKKDRGRNSNSRKRSGTFNPMTV